MPFQSGQTITIISYVFQSFYSFSKVKTISSVDIFKKLSRTHLFRESNNTWYDILCMLITLVYGHVHARGTICRLIVTGLRYQIPAILFYRAMLNFRFLFNYFWTIGPTDLANGYRQSQNFNGSSIRCAGTIQNYLFSGHFVSFPTFSRWRGKYIVRFLDICSTNSRIVCGVLKVLEVFEVLEFYKKCATRMEIAAQRSLHFSVGKCVTWKNRKNV